MGTYFVDRRFELLSPTTFVEVWIRTTNSFSALLIFLVGFFVSSRR